MAEQLTHLDDRFWNRLLKAIEEGQVVPVIGSQLLTWNDQDKIQTLQPLVAMRGCWSFNVSTPLKNPVRSCPEARVSMAKRAVNSLGSIRREPWRHVAGLLMVLAG
jgi:hypothetical protein